MDKSVRKSLITSYLNGTITARDFNEKIFRADFTATTDPLLGAMGADLRTKEMESLIRAEIIAFDKRAETELSSLGSDYIESTKYRLTMEGASYENLLADEEIRAIFDKWGTTNVRNTLESPSSNYEKTNFRSLIKFLTEHPEYDDEIQEILSEIQEEQGLSEELEKFSEKVTQGRNDAKVEQETKQEFSTFLDESLHAFDVLLQLHYIDEDSVQINKEAFVQAYEIYKTKLSYLMEKVGDNSDFFAKTPTLKFIPGKGNVLTPISKNQEKIDQIESLIAQLEDRYGSPVQESGNSEKKHVEEKSIKDEVGDEFKEPSQAELQEQREAEARIMHSMQAIIGQAMQFETRVTDKKDASKVLADALDRDRKENQVEMQKKQDEGR